MSEGVAPSTVPNPTVERYARHVNPAFVKLLGTLGYGRVFTRARDVWLWDDQGRQYLDFLAGFGSANLGHNPPASSRGCSASSPRRRSGVPLLPGGAARHGAAHMVSDRNSFMSGATVVLDGAV